MVFDSCCIISMIYGDLFSSCPILYAKNIVFCLFIKSLIYSIPNAWFLFACEQNIKKLSSL